VKLSQLKTRNYGRNARAIAIVIPLALLIAALGNLPAPFARGIAPHATDKLARTMFWAWERPERLEFIDIEHTGVAFLARTLYLRGDEVIVRPRLQKLKTPPSSNLVAVVRLEADPRELPSLSSIQILRTVNAIAELPRLTDVHAIQIDFDATRSERGFYRRLLFLLREKLGHSTWISITALASWCIHDDWLADLPIDEAVPMLFRMGVGHREVMNYLNTHKGFSTAVCQTSVGVSTDEFLAPLPPHRRTYLFNPKPWTPEAVGRAMKQLGL
jgi:hypothetical protein